MSNRTTDGDLSRHLRARSERLLVPGAQDYLELSGEPDFPRFFTDARGHRVRDPEGRWYDDFYLGSGAVILGHGHPGQVEYVTNNLGHGATVSLRHPIEVALAERLHDLVPCVDRFMFFKTGSECAHLALRTALRATGRKQVISFGYHGWITPFDDHAIQRSELEIADPGWEIAQAEAAIRNAGSSLAAVMVSPSPFATDPEFYRRIGAATRETGALLIMDEIKSGFRFRFPCLSMAFDLRPDMLLLAKAVSNGFPLAVMGGREELMADRDLISVFSTFASETVSLFASDYCLRELSEGAYQRFGQASSHFHRLLTAAFEESDIEVVGDPMFFRLRLPDGIDYGLVSSRLASRGLLLHPRDEVIVSAAHNDAALLQSAAERCREALRELSEPQAER